MAAVLVGTRPLTGHGVRLDDPAQTVATDDNYVIPNNGRIFLYVDLSADGNVTVESNRTVDGLALPHRVIAVASAEQRLLGPFPVDTHNGTHTVGAVSHMGTMNVTFSAAGTIAAIQIP